MDGTADVIEYPLAFIGQIGRPTVIKSWVESLYGIPYNEQELYYKRLRLDDDNFPPKRNFDDQSNIILDLRLEPHDVKLVVFKSLFTNKFTNAIYKQNNIRTISSIHLKGFGCYSTWTYNYRGKAGESITQFLEKTLNIPKNRLYFFLHQRRYSAGALISEITRGLPLKPKSSILNDGRLRDDSLPDHIQKAMDERENPVTSPLEVKLAV